MVKVLDRGAGHGRFLGLPLSNRSYCAEGFIIHHFGNAMMADVKFQLLRAVYFLIRVEQPLPSLLGSGSLYHADRVRYSNKKTRGVPSV